jgi:glutaconate CoA-transferase, subunit B
MTGLGWTADEMMTIAAARQLRPATSCFVGIGLPSVAANLARATHAPDLALIYESGCLGAHPTRLPLSIGDGILADTATAVITVPEVFNYWLQPGRIDVGFLAAAQLDRYANINTTVIGNYTTPTVRLPGAGGAPEIAASCREGIIIVRQTPRTFVQTLDFITSFGFGTGTGDREHLGLHGNGPRTVITDIGILTPNPHTCELTLTALHPGATITQAQTNTGWNLAIAEDLGRTDEPTTEELRVLRGLTSVTDDEATGSRTIASHA